MRAENNCEDEAVDADNKIGDGSSSIGGQDYYAVTKHYAIKLRLRDEG